MSRLADASRAGRPAAAPRTAYWALVLPALFAFWLYIPILRLPNQYDTLLHTQLADELTLASVWLPNEGFGFYRPLVFFPLVLIRLLAGGYPAAWLQGLNLLQHTVNAALTAGLIWRLTGHRRQALIGGLLMAAFPFAYQALAIYGNNGYLTVTGLLLLGLHLSLTRRPRRGLALGLVQLAALLVHEIGALLLPLVLWLSWTTAGQEKPLDHIRFKPPIGLRPLAPAAVILLLYLAVYPFLPRGGGPQLDFGGNDIGPKLLFFTQTAAYPLTGLAAWVPDYSALTVILGGAAVVLLWTGWRWARWPEMRPLLLAGAGWWLLNSLLVAVTLPTYYIVDGARLLYPGSVGLVLFWTGLLAPGRAAGRLAAAPLLLLAAALLVHNAGFVRRMIDYYALVGAPVAVLVENLADQPAADGVVWVNPPQWVSPPRNSFAMGAELAPLLGSHLFASELLEANGGVERPFTILAAPGIQSDTPYHVGIYGLGGVDRLEPDGLPAAVSHVFVTTYADERIETRYAGRLEKGEPPPVGLAAIGPFRVAAGAAARCADGVWVQLELWPAAEPAATLSLFVQVLGEDGTLKAQLDGPPLGIPTGRLGWSPRVRLVEWRLLNGVEDSVPAVVVGAYDFASGERYPAAGPDGFPLADNALRLPVGPPAVACFP